MNAVQKILADLSDDDLKKALGELKVLENKGVLPEGITRKLAHTLQEEAGLTAHDARSVAQSSIFRIAAFKWADL